MRHRLGEVGYQLLVGLQVAYGTLFTVLLGAVEVEVVVVCRTLQVVLDDDDPRMLSLTAFGQVVNEGDTIFLFLLVGFLLILCQN